MHRCGCGDEEIRLAEGDALGLAGRNHATADEDHLLVHRQYAPVEPGPKPGLDPVGQKLSEVGIWMPLDAEADLGHGHGAQMQEFGGLGVRPSLDCWMAGGFSQLGDHVSIEQITPQSSTSRTGLLTPSSPKSSSASGELASRSCRVGRPALATSRSNSSAATTTTASR